MDRTPTIPSCVIIERSLIFSFVYGLDRESRFLHSEFAENRPANILEESFGAHVGAPYSLFVVPTNLYNLKMTVKLTKSANRTMS